MKHLILTTALCLSLTACESIGMGEFEWPSLNPWSESEQVDNIQEDAVIESVAVDAMAIETELNEMEKLTGMRLEAPEQPVVETPEVTDVEEIEIIEVFDETEIVDVSAVKEPVEVAEVIEEIDAEDVAETKTLEMHQIEEIEEAEEVVEKAEVMTHQAGATGNENGCPAIEMMPSTQSMTYFEDGISGDFVARASLSKVRGGCEIVNGGMEVDLDMLMRGTITDKGRFDGNANEEAFMTFPYFVSVLSPSGKALDKKIMATAMRFRPSVDYIDHAEKITQFIPMDDVTQSANYKIVVGYQLTRNQLEYNRAEVAARPDDVRASVDTTPARRLSYNPLADE